MSKNTGKPFEKLTQEIYQALCDFDTSENGFKKIQVQHDVKIQGKSGTPHQIDVFWEFDLAGVNYKTLVEVKDWKSSVKKEQISSLKGKIDDIPNSKGIFVSRTGFQEGAKTFAEHYGVQLVTLTEKSDFKIALNFITTNYDSLQLIFDTDDLQNTPGSIDDLKKALYEEKLENIVVISPDKIPNRIFNLMCVDAKPYYYEGDGIRHRVKRELEGDWYVLSNKGSFPMIKIYGYVFSCYNTSETYFLTLDNLPTVCIKNILEGTEWHYNKNEQSIMGIPHCLIEV